MLQGNFVPFDAGVLYLLMSKTFLNPRLNSEVLPLVQLIRYLDFIKSRLFAKNYSFDKKSIDYQGVGCSGFN